MQLLRKKGMLDSNRVLFLPVDAIAPNPDQPRRVGCFPSTSWRSWPPPSAPWACSSPSPYAVGSAAGSWWLGSAACGRPSWPGSPRSPASPSRSTASGPPCWPCLALNKLISTYHLSQEEAARRIGKSQSAVANKLRLLKLPTPVLERLRDGGATERHARALLPLADPVLQIQAADTILKEKLTVAQTEALVDQLLHPAPPAPPVRRPRRVFVVKDVRLFLNSLNRGMALMRSAGVDAQCSREDREEEILLTIHIPRRAQEHVSRETKQLTSIDS